MTPVRLEPYLNLCNMLACLLTMGPSTTKQEGTDRYTFLVLPFRMDDGTLTSWCREPGVRMSCLAMPRIVRSPWIAQPVYYPNMLKIQEKVSIILTKFFHTIVNIFLPIFFNICFGCSKEPSHGSFEYPQHMFWLRNKKIFFITLF